MMAYDSLREEMIVVLFLDIKLWVLIAAIA
jgi:hypothetical protein